MKTITRTAGLMLLLGASAVVAGPLGAGTSYGGAQFALVTYSDEDLSDDAEPTAVVGRIGTFLEDRISIEGRLGMGLTDDDVGAVDFEVDQLLGVYGLGHLPVNDELSLYGALGFSMGEGTASTSEGSASEDESGLSYGFGADVRLSSTTDLNLEFMQYLDDSDFDVSALAAGVRWSF